MTNIEKYKKTFMEAFDIKDENLVETLEYMEIEAWDSVGHMTLVAMLEEAFDIMMDTDDIIDLSSYVRGTEILKNNYGIEF